MKKHNALLLVLGFQLLMAGWVLHEGLYVDVPFWSASRKFDAALARHDWDGTRQAMDDQRVAMCRSWLMRPVTCD